MREMHLLPGLGKLDSIDPLVVARIANVVEVIVYTGIAFAVDFTAHWKTLDVAAVVITPKECDIIRDPHAPLIVASYLLQRS